MRNSRRADWEGDRQEGLGTIGGPRFKEDGIFLKRNIGLVQMLYRLVDWLIWSWAQSSSWSP